MPRHCTVTLLCLFLLSGCAFLNKKEVMPSSQYAGKTLPRGKSFHFFSVEVDSDGTDATPEYIASQFAKFFTPFSQIVSASGKMNTQNEGFEKATDNHADYAVQLRIDRWESRMYRGQFVKVGVTIFDLSTGEPVAGSDFRADCVVDLMGADRSTTKCAGSVVRPWLESLFAN